MKLCSVELEYVLLHRALSLDPGGCSVRCERVGGSRKRPRSRGAVKAGRMGAGEADARRQRCHERYNAGSTFISLQPTEETRICLDPSCHRSVPAAAEIDSVLPSICERLKVHKLP